MSHHVTVLLLVEPSNLRKNVNRAKNRYWNHKRTKKRKHVKISRKVPLHVTFLLPLGPLGKGFNITEYGKGPQGELQQLSGSSFECLENGTTFSRGANKRIESAGTSKSKGTNWLSSKWKDGTPFVFNQIKKNVTNESDSGCDIKIQKGHHWLRTKTPSVLQRIWL